MDVAAVLVVFVGAATFFTFFSFCKRATGFVALTVVSGALAATMIWGWWTTGAGLEAIVAGTDSFFAAANDVVAFFWVAGSAYTSAFLASSSFLGSAFVEVFDFLLLRALTSSFWSLIC
jgi:hypothetical protein